MNKIKPKKENSFSKKVFQSEKMDQIKSESTDIRNKPKSKKLIVKTYIDDDESDGINSMIDDVLSISAISKYEKSENAKPNNKVESK